MGLEPERLWEELALEKAGTRRRKRSREALNYEKFEACANCTSKNTVPVGPKRKWQALKRLPFPGVFEVDSSEQEFED